MGNCLSISSAQVNASPAVENARPAAFDEIRQYIGHDARLEHKLMELQRDGHFSIPMSVATRSILNSHINDPNGWNYSRLRSIETKGLVHSEIGDCLSQLAHQVALKTIKSDPGDIRLKAHEIEIRKVFDNGASDWHVDRAPKWITCLALLRGNSTTQYVT